MQNKRPKTTLFMIMSVDGKISTGDTDLLDFDKDLPKISGVKEGFHQYYEIEAKTDLHSLNSGRVMAKVGANNHLHEKIEKLAVRFIVIDNKPHLDENGVDYFVKRSNIFYLVTTNKNHPVYNRIGEKNLKIIYYPTKIDFIDLFRRFKAEFGIKSMTIQTGGELNSEFIRNGLVDELSIVIAPVLIGGRGTSSLIDGESLHSIKDLEKIRPLKLISCKKLADSYIHLKYRVINSR